VPIAWKFFMLLALIVPSLLAVSWLGGRGMVEMKARLDDVYEDTSRARERSGRSRSPSSRPKSCRCD
jgi:hypothetical protein